MSYHAFIVIFPEILPYLLLRFRSSFNDPRYDPWTSASQAFVLPPDGRKNWNDRGISAVSTASPGDANAGSGKVSAARAGALGESATRFHFIPLQIEGFVEDAVDEQ